MTEQHENLQADKTPEVHNAGDRAPGKADDKTNRDGLAALAILALTIGFIVVIVVFAIA
ncbi:hypothetical protein [Candidatus Poriferisocius sp.]|uniref:hypothetical protein n=1 Tax=Candidatus Poriferisocius sp. TaxID=3101276 RepID=UPI003B593645